MADDSERRVADSALSGPIAAALPRAMLALVDELTSTMFCLKDADGRYVAFESAASNLAAGDADSIPDVFVKDLSTGVTTLISTTTGGGTKGNNLSFDPSI